MRETLSCARPIVTNKNAIAILRNMGTPFKGRRVNELYERKRRHSPASFVPVRKYAASFLTCRGGHSCATFLGIPSLPLQCCCRSATPSLPHQSRPHAQ